MRNRLIEWKAPALLLGSIGIAGIGDFIYLVAINIIVYQLTGSATAVAGLWIIGPLTNIVTKFWTGSYIDYRSKRKVMIVTYLMRAGFIFLIPLAPNMIVIYSILVCLSVAKAFFGPSSMTYVAMLVPKEKRKRFNAIRSFTSSGAFIVGPAVGGTLILLTSITVTLWINAMLFVFAAALLARLPDIERVDKKLIPKLTGKQVISDFSIVKAFLLKNKYVASIYIGFIFIMLFSFAMDAQEVVFTQQVIGLSEVEYSLLISITGIGSVAGATILSVFSDRFSLRYMMVIGMVMTTVGYIVYAFSWSFQTIATGFIILGFFQVYLNAGVTTFYQNNVPTEVMGRVTSIFQLMQSILQVMFILGIGITADIIPLRSTIVMSSVTMLVLSIIFSVAVFLPVKKRYYLEED
ncbi:MFS transporter [Salipaludibacillus daqingensis]|uniref:MFS transporter n=1 Tax=Salipaludibacillus daqingensis TaxID=3041001 RepID=UPI0024759C3E|nr:MFS transporter [Salipaludibacillus daqingensis]